MKNTYIDLFKMIKRSLKNEKANLRPYGVGMWRVCCECW